MLTSTKASDTTESGFLSKASKTSLGDYKKFVTQRVNHKAADSLSYQSGSAADWQYDGMSFSTASDRLAAPAQDSMAFTSARVVEDPAVQKLLATDSSMRIGMPAKASDTTESGFLSKTSKTSLGDYSKFVTQRVNHKAADSLSYQSGSAADWQYDGMSFSTASDRLAAPAQDSMAFTSARVVEDPAVQKLLATDSSMRIGMPAMGVALLAFAAMLGIHMRRRQHRATTFASSDEDESDMSIALADRTNSPVSVFDPLGLFADSENKHYLVKRYGGAELTHGRVAMFAGSSMAFSSQRGLT